MSAVTSEGKGRGVFASSMNNLDVILIHSALYIFAIPYNGPYYKRVPTVLPTFRIEANFSFPFLKNMKWMT